MKLNLFPGQTRSNARRLAAGVLAAVLIAAASACTAGGGGGHSTPKSGGLIVWAHKSAVSTIDPAHSDYDQTADVDQLIYNTLVTYNENGQLVGQLATSFGYSSDVKSIRIVLRKNVRFHDGTQLTAADVKYTLDRDQSIGQGIDTMITDYQSTSVINSHQLLIHLKKPDTLFLGALSKIFIVNATLVAKHAGSDHAQSWLGSHDAGSGPYVLSSVAPDRVVTTRYDKYWNYSAHRPAKFVETQVDDASTRRDDLIRGQISAADLDPHDWQAAEKAGLKIYRSPSNGLMLVYFNTEYGATSKLPVREAIADAFDYQGAQTKIELGAAQLASGPLPSYLACRPKLPTVSRSVQQARSLLKQAGIKHLTLTMRYQPSFSDQVQVATLLKSDLAQIGVTLNLTPITFPAYLTTLQSFKTIPQMMLATESPAYPDPGIMLEQSYSSTAVGTNKTAYHNPKVDKLLNQAKAAPQAQTRCDLYREAQMIVAADHPVMPIMLLLGGVGYSSKITGVSPKSTPYGFNLAKLEVRP